MKIKFMVAATLMAALVTTTSCGKNGAGGSGGIEHR